MILRENTENPDFDYVVQISPEAQELIADSVFSRLKVLEGALNFVTNPISKKKMKFPLSLSMSLIETFSQQAEDFLHLVSPEETDDGTIERQIAYSGIRQLSAILESRQEYHDNTREHGGEISYVSMAGVSYSKLPDNRAGALASKLNLSMSVIALEKTVQLEEENLSMAGAL